MNSEDDVFERLKHTADPEVQKEREAAVRERVTAQYEKAQKRLSELIHNNSTLPVQIRSIQVHGTKNTSRRFLERVLKPVLSAEKQQAYTLESALKELNNVTGKLHQFEIFRPDISISLDTQSPLSTTPYSKSSPPSPTPIDVLLTVKDRPRFALKSGTDISTTEASGNFSLSTLNLLGHADRFNFTASRGTRTRTSYTGTVSAPVPLLANPDLIAKLSANEHTRSNQDTASHEEVLRGTKASVQWITPVTRDMHEWSAEWDWRQVTGLSRDASEEVRAEAGDNIKVALRYAFQRDFRDNSMLPSKGYLLRSVTEVAGGAGALGGLGGLGSSIVGDVAHVKNESEFQFALPLFPSQKQAKESEPQSVFQCVKSYLAATTLMTTLRAAVLYPLPVLEEMGPPGRVMYPASHLSDRIHLGGPTPLRLFKPSALGPRSTSPSSDALGGDVAYSFSSSLLLPIPRVGPSAPLRLQGFVNGGRVLAWESVGKRGKPDVTEMWDRILGEGPSFTAGVGLVYAHPVVRAEVNFGVPVVVRKGEVTRKGFQFGIGMEAW